MSTRVYPVMLVCPLCQHASLSSELLPESRLEYEAEDDEGVVAKHTEHFGLVWDITCPDCEFNFICQREQG